MNDNILKSFFAIILTFSLQLLAMGYCFGFDMNFSSDHLKNDTITSQIKEHNWQSSTSIYFELGGRFTYTLNVDFRKKENFAVSVNFCYWVDEGDPADLLFVPSVMCYYLKGKRHSLELGGGLGSLIIQNRGFVSVMLHSNIGYRYQQKNGLIFRVGFTPWVALPIDGRSKFWATPWAGISFGYSF